MQGFVVGRLALHQCAGQRGIEWRQGHRAVGHHFDRRAALAKQVPRAEHAVDAGADDQLVGMADRISLFVGLVSERALRPCIETLR